MKKVLIAAGVALAGASVIVAAKGATQSTTAPVASVAAETTQKAGNRTMSSLGPAAAVRRAALARQAAKERQAAAAGTTDGLRPGDLPAGTSVETVFDK